MKWFKRIAEVSAGFCREAATDHSPGLQPWVRQTETLACLSAVVLGKWDEGGKVAPDVSVTGWVNTPCPEHTRRSPLVRRFVLVLVVVLVLDSCYAGYWSIGVLELCALTELHPATAGLGMLSGRFIVSPHPGLKPWAILYNRFAVKSDEQPGSKVFTPGLFYQTISWSGTTGISELFKTW